MNIGTEEQEVQRNSGYRGIWELRNSRVRGIVDTGTQEFRNSK